MQSRPQYSLYNVAAINWADVSSGNYTQVGELEIGTQQAETSPAVKLTYLRAM